MIVNLINTETWLVENIIIVDSIDSYVPSNGFMVDISQSAKIGDTYDYKTGQYISNKPTLEQRNAAIKAQRAERYKNEAEIYTQRLILGEVTQEFVLAIRDKIKSELPYEVE